MATTGNKSKKSPFGFLTKNPTLHTHATAQARDQLSQVIDDFIKSDYIAHHPDLIKSSIVPPNVIEVIDEKKISQYFANLKKDLSVNHTHPMQMAYRAIIDVYGDDLEQYEKFYKLGFRETEFMKRLNNIVLWIDRAGQEAEMREYYEFHYPGYKFFTEEEIDWLCKKYGLLFAEVKYYKDEVPRKVLQRLAAFKLNHNDRVYQSPYTGGAVNRNLTQKLEKDEQLLQVDSPMWLMAPKDMFNVPTNYTIKGNRIVQLPKKDPLAFMPVNWGYLLVEAWGEESYLDEVINPARN